MPQLISSSKVFSNPSFNTYVPQLSDNADIQNAFELFYYGNFETGNGYDTTNSIYANLLSFDTRIDTVENNLTGHVGADSAIHGLDDAGPGGSDGGNVVGTSAEQTLTNKTLTSPAITGGTLNGGVALTVSSTELNALDGITSSVAELNILDGVTSNASELNILDGATLSTSELNLLDGVTASTSEINFLSGATSNIQDQINLKPTLRYEGTIVNRNIFVQAAQPTAVNVGDIWFDF